MRLARFFWLSLLAWPTVALGDFIYSDFTSTAGLNLVGSAAAEGSVLRLTPSIKQNIGGAWRTERQDIASGFDTTVSFRLSEPGPFDGADGWAFVVQDWDGEALGYVGRDIGYAGIPRSLAVEVDTFFNLDLGDPPSDHLGILSLGELPNSPNHTIAGYGLSALTDDLYDGIERTLRVRYVPGMLEVFYDGSVTPALSAALDLPALLGSTDGHAFVGFTSATGAAWGNHDLTSWSFQKVPEPSTAGMLAVLTLLGMYRRRRL